jgi:predicted glycoside hydrolase/deacetylase ChbG (UPF0249 family)
MKHLIVNVDDFGMTRGVNMGIIDAGGMVVATPSPVVVSKLAFEEAAQLIGENPNVDTGPRLSLTVRKPVCNDLALNRSFPDGAFRLGNGDLLISRGTFTNAPG